MKMSRLLYFCIILILVNDASASILKKRWWWNAVVYQLYPRSFKDANNDGIGDLNGITSKIGYLADSGINVIWLAPIYASPLANFGFDITDFRDVHPDYGTMQDLKNLIVAAKNVGIKIIMDLVPNHTSDKHVWFLKALEHQGKYRNYYLWRDGTKNNERPPNNWLSVNNGSAWSPTAHQWYFHQFGSTQPDLNYHNPEVIEEMDDVIRYWLRKGIDGFCLHDVSHLVENGRFLNNPRSHLPGIQEQDYRYLDHVYTRDNPDSYELIAHWRKLLDNFSDYHEQDEKLLLTSAFTIIPYSTKFYHFGSQVPLNLNFLDINTIITADHLRNIINEGINYMPIGATLNWMLGNYYSSRIESRFARRGDQLIMLQMILPGIAITYYGEEIGMVDKENLSCSKRKNHEERMCNVDAYNSRLYEPNRTPFQWDSTQNAGFSKAEFTWIPVHDNYRKINLIDQQTTDDSYYKLYTTLTKLRHQNSAVYSENIWTLVKNNGKVLVVIRQDGINSVVFLMNFDVFDDQVVNLQRESQCPMRRMVAVASRTSPIKQGTIINISAIIVPPQSALIIVSK